MLNLKKLLTKILQFLYAETTPQEESIQYSNGTEAINFYFRASRNFLSVLAIREASTMSFPTSWTYIGTLSSIRPQYTRYIPLSTPSGNTVTVKILSDGKVSIIADTSSAFWVQTSGTVILK